MDLTPTEHQGGQHSKAGTSRKLLKTRKTKEYVGKNGHDEGSESGETHSHGVTWRTGSETKMNG